MDLVSTRPVRVAMALAMRIGAFCERHFAVIAVYGVWKLLLVHAMTVANSAAKASNNEWNRYFTKDSHFWAAPFLNWDGHHYLFLAQDGYSAERQGALAFYPLFPLTTTLVRLLSFDVFEAAFITTTLFGLLFLLLFRSALKQLPVGHKQSLWATVLVLCYPSSFYLTAFYAEGAALFVFMGFFYFYAIRKQKLSFLFAFLLPWTKGQGWFLGVLPALDIMVSAVGRRKKELFLATFNLLALGAGALSLLAFYKLTTGNTFAFIDAQKTYIFNNSISNIFSLSHFLRSFYSASSDLFSYNDSIVDKLFIGFMFLCFFPVAFSKDWKVIVLFLALVLPAAMMGDGGSFSRHSLLVWPFVVLSIARQNLLGKMGFCIFSGFFLMVQLYFATRFAANLWVG
jgi:hypothetical protein